MPDHSSRESGPHHDQHSRDAAHLAQFGYTQELDRRLNFFSTFAIAFSFISATTGIFSLFWYGLDTGGPAYIWTWPIVFFGQLLVALTFSEVGSHYPIAGGIYQWCRHLFGTTYAWFGAWMYLIALLVTVAAVDFGVAPVFCSLVGIEPTRWTLTFVGVGFAVVQAILSLTGIRIMALVNNIGTVTEIVGMIGIAAFLILAIIFGDSAHQSVGVIFDTAGVEGTGGYFGAFLAAMLASAWVLYGFDSAGNMAEETLNPTKEVPKAILTALTGTFLIGGVFIFAALVAIPDMDEAIAKGVDVLPYILESHFPSWITDLFLLIVVVAIFVCGLAVMTTAARLFYSYGRDGQIPASGFFRTISKRFQTPLNATVFIVVFTAVLLVIFQEQLPRIIAWATAGMYIPYQMVVFASMRARTKGWPHRKAGFNLGVWGWPVNLVGFAYGVFMIINMCWPRTPDAAWYDNYLVPLSIGIAFGVGVLFFIYQRSRGMKMEISLPEPSAQAALTVEED